MVVNLQLENLECHGDYGHCLRKPGSCSCLRWHIQHEEAVVLEDGLEAGKGLLRHKEAELVMFGLPRGRISHRSKLPVLQTVIVSARRRTCMSRCRPFHELSYAMLRTRWPTPARSRRQDWRRGRGHGRCCICHHKRKTE